MKAGLLLVAVGAAAMLAWEANLIPRKVKATQSVTMNLGDGSGRTYSTQIRTIYLPRLITADEVKLPNGRWIHCKNDCFEAFRAATRNGGN